MTKPELKAEKAAADAAAAAAKKQRTMLDFFSKLTKRGRRAKQRETRGRRAQTPTVAAVPPAPAAAPAPAPAPVATAAPKATRTNWSKGENLKLLTNAVTEWKESSGRAAPREFLGETAPRKPTLAEFAVIVGIPKGTLGPYVTGNGKARVLGASVGAQAHLDANESQFVVDNIRRHDRANDGLSKQAEIVTVSRFWLQLQCDCGSIR